MYTIHVQKECQKSKYYNKKFRFFLCWVQHTKSVNGNDRISLFIHSLHSHLVCNNWQLENYDCIICIFFVAIHRHSFASIYSHYASLSTKWETVSMQHTAIAVIHWKKRKKTMMIKWIEKKNFHYNGLGSKLEIKISLTHFILNVVLLYFSCSATNRNGYIIILHRNQWDENYEIDILNRKKKHFFLSLFLFTLIHVRCLNKQMINQKI